MAFASSSSPSSSSSSPPAGAPSVVLGLPGSELQSNMEIKVKTKARAGSEYENPTVYQAHYSHELSSSMPAIQHSQTFHPIIDSAHPVHPPHPLQPAGSLAMVEDGPFFSNTKQFYSLYNMNQTQSYKLRVMARIDRGFFTANKIWTCYRRNYFQVSTAFSILGFDHSQESEVPCLIELKDPITSPDQGELSAQRDTNSMIGSLDGLRLNDHGASSHGTSRLAVVTSFSICITSKIASTDKKIDLIQHTPKRDKGPQIVPGLRAVRGGGTLTLTGANTNQTVVTFERVQFKTATANNGKRRAAQQFYILMVDLYAHTEDGQVFCVASSQSDSLVVRGRSPGHYIDTPERDEILSPSSAGERRLSNIGQHPYHFPGTHSRSHSISAGAGMSVDVSSLGFGGVEGPLSPVSPGVTSEYSPTAAPTPSFYRYPSHQSAWTDGSSMSSPSSTYEASAFSSPTTGYPTMHQYQGQHSPQEHSHSSYFTQRQPSFGSITPRLMMGPTGLSPRHPFDNQLEPPQENSNEQDDSSRAYFNQSYNNPPQSNGFVGVSAAGAPGGLSDQVFVKTEVQESYFPYPNSFTNSSGHPMNESGMSVGNSVGTSAGEPTPSSTSASSVSSSFGYTVQELGGMDAHSPQPALPQNGLYEGSFVSAANPYRTTTTAGPPLTPYGHHSEMQGAAASLYQHGQDHHKVVAWS
ncbi:hypothetical protein BCR41DRAFT_68321 [Lobosporangium transversale]|uniref:NDT80 domain-containing protein n=1 Tax=Lobosporangium transversale TaxID=64571 RepID=A0A1Y2H393_9FUNG|nr:hypothetical protein BCR41DRAFT_68321 [Lobosporangium transversale]ORZ28183.1 hypothetical protein BCR41DRAFT_68321 [Lobosporangium transversale]|eukprot:XP_021885868.1 hypothetical protein BCR41DRAFT_68321 [Lobosporangium transversale]